MSDTMEQIKDKLHDIAAIKNGGIIAFEEVANAFPDLSEDRLCSYLSILKNNGFVKPVLANGRLMGPNEFYVFRLNT